MRRAMGFWCAAALAACTASTAQAGFITPDGTLGDLSDGGKLVGTSFDPHNDTLSEVNAGISLWNSTFPDTDLPSATTILAKFENEPLEDVIGSFDPSDFEWYSTTDGTAFTLLSDPADILNVGAIGFKWIGAAGGDAEFGYYTPKSDATNGGFSVWKYTEGAINLAYVDADGDLDTFDPRANDKGNAFAISHLSIYGSDDTTINELPEPGSLTLLVIGALSAGGIGLRRRIRGARA